MSEFEVAEKIGNLLIVYGARIEDAAEIIKLYKNGGDIEKKYDEIVKKSLRGEIK